MQMEKWRNCFEFLIQLNCDNSMFVDYRLKLKQNRFYKEIGLETNVLTLFITKTQKKHHFQGFKKCCKTRLERKVIIIFSKSIKMAYNGMSTLYADMNCLIFIIPLRFTFLLLGVLKFIRDQCLLERVELENLEDLLMAWLSLC